VQILKNGMCPYFLMIAIQGFGGRIFRPYRVSNIPITQGLGLTSLSKGADFEKWEVTLF
jgi:hypothetical protein